MRLTRQSPTTSHPKASSFLGMQSLEERMLLAADVLPDLYAWESESRGYLHDYQVQGNLLRFSTALANGGDGHLEVRGTDQVNGDGDELVVQRIYDDEGGFRDVDAGFFTYHPSHGHIHFDGYAIYHLRERLADDSMGDIVASGGKVSFCLIDITAIPGSGGTSNYGGCGNIQGISAGWSDVYSRSLADQWINISGINDGDYYLQVIVDPDDQLIESDETNNETVIPVSIVGGPGAQGDHLESNNSFSQAANLGMISYRLEPGLSIHTGSDVDFYQVTAAGDGDLTASINFTDDLGNLDLRVYDDAQNLLSTSNSTDDNESLTWAANAGETFYVEVFSAGTDENAYELEIDGPGNVISASVSAEDTPIDIPDGISNGSPGATITSTLEGADVTLSDVNVMLTDLEHSYLADLHIELTSPAGTTAVLIYSDFEPGNNGLLGGDSNFSGTVLDDQAPTNLGSGSAPYSGSFNINDGSNVNPLAAFNGENALGTWTISISDWFAADDGTLRDWGLVFTGIDNNPGDRFELNDAFPQAEDLGSLGSAAEAGLTIHTDEDKDFFRFTAADSGTATIDLSFLHGDGDLTLVAYSDSLSEIARGDSTTDNESLSIALESGELLYLEVFGDSGAMNTYDLAVTVTPSLIGDFDGDGTLTILDIDALSAEAAAGTNNADYDVTDDGLVNQTDVVAWVEAVYNTALGDVNLDGNVDLLDLDILGSNWSQPGVYSQGDVTSDGVVNLLDLDILGQNWGFTTATATSAFTFVETPQAAKAQGRATAGSLTGSGRASVLSSGDDEGQLVRG